MSWDVILREMGNWWRIFSWGVVRLYLYLGRIYYFRGLERRMVGEGFRISLFFLGNGADFFGLICVFFLGNFR